MLCRHCQQSVVSRPRGLCWTCFYEPEIRKQYPATSKFARKGLAYDNVAAMPATFPTQALPGTPEKIAILQQRALSKQQLFHPHDASFHTPALVSSRAG